MGKRQEQSSQMFGYLLSLSHLFYLTKHSKVFFLEIMTPTGGTTCLVLSLSSPSSQNVKEFSKNILRSPKLGVILRFTNFREIVLYKNTPAETLVTQLSKKSTIELIENNKELLETFENLWGNGELISRQCNTPWETIRSPES